MSHHGLESLGKLETGCCGTAVELSRRSCICGETLRPLRRTSHAALAQLDQGELIEIPIHLCTDPREVGYRKSRLGKPRGQLRQYRMRASKLDPRDPRELHIREYPEQYMLHIDRYPVTHPAHAVLETPHFNSAILTCLSAVQMALREARSKLLGDD